MSNIDKIERRIKGLLAKAADREGTPEGDACRDKAISLMAQYGVEEAKLNTDEGNAMTSRTIKLGGSYTHQQSYLYAAIANALHCKTIAMGTGRKTNEITIFGRARHVERAVMLGTILNPQMITGSNNAPAELYVSTVVGKRSWMIGFIHRLALRLEEIETHTFSQASAEGHTATDEIVLADDAFLAEEMASKAFPNAKAVERKAQRSADAYNAGQDAADNTDIGQNRMSARAALTA